MKIKRIVRTTLYIIATNRPLLATQAVYFSVYHHWYCEFESRLVCGVQHYVIKFVSRFLRVIRFSTFKTDRHDIIKILLKVALNTKRKK
jgi:hypothetical protein